MNKKLKVVVTFTQFIASIITNSTGVVPAVMLESFMDFHGINKVLEEIQLLNYRLSSLVHI